MTTSPAVPQPAPGATLEPTPGPSRSSLRLLTVCSHNRTRSVIIAALMQAMLTERLGVGAVQVRSGGFGPEGLPAIDDAVASMARRGLDVSAHRSTSVTAELVAGADLIVTAERAHVVRIASMAPSAFARTATLPELVALADDAGDANGADVRTRVAGLIGERGAQEYLRAPIRDVPDPTGEPPRVFERAVVEIERQCAALAALLARLADPAA